MKIFDKLAWMPVRGRRVLFARSRGETLFYSAGGKRKPGETDEQALRREVREELSVELYVPSIKHIHTFHGPAHGHPEDKVEMQMACYDAQHFGELTPSNEVVEIAWFTIADVPRTTPMGRTILLWFKDNGLID